jgi:hypothetical protein
MPVAQTRMRALTFVRARSGCRRESASLRPTALPQHLAQRARSAQPWASHILRPILALSLPRTVLVARERLL